MLIVTLSSARLSIGSDHALLLLAAADLGAYGGIRILSIRKRQLACLSLSPATTTPLTRALSIGASGGRFGLAE